MTPAERPTQEVAPRTSAGRALKSEYPGVWWWRDEQYPKRWTGPLGEAIEAEASRSAPPAAVTDETLTDAIASALFDTPHWRLNESAYDSNTTYENRHRFAAILASKVLSKLPAARADEPLLQAALDWRDVAKQLEAGGFDGDDRRSQSARVIEVGQAIRIVRAALASAEPAEVDGDE